MHYVTNTLSLLFFLLYVGCPFPPWLYVMLLHFAYDLSNWSSPPFSSTTIKNLPGISDLLSKMPMFLHHTKLYSKLNQHNDAPQDSKCSIWLVSSLYLCPVCQWKVFLLKFASAIEILDLNSLAHLVSFAIVLPKQLKYSTFSSCTLKTLLMKEYTTMMITKTTTTTTTTTTCNGNVTTTPPTMIYHGNVCYMNSTWEFLFYGLFIGPVTNFGYTLLHKWKRVNSELEVMWKEVITA